MTKFKELFEDDNAGEYNQAKREQREEKERKANIAKIHEGGLAIARILVPKLSRLTGKQWGFENSAIYATYGMEPHSIMKNPGRLKAYKEIKTDHSVITELFIKAFEGERAFKSLDITDAEAIFTFEGDKWEVSWWGKKPDFKIQRKY